MTRDQAETLLDRFGRNRAAATLRSYRQDLADFARWCLPAAPGDVAAAVAHLLGSGPGPARSIGLVYRAHLADRGLSPATIGRRLATLRSLAHEARRLGLTGWALEVEGPRLTPYRETAGPGLSGWKALGAIAAARAVNPRGRRNLAVVRLLHDLALRRGELVRLDLADYDPDERLLSVLGKGKSEPVPLRVPGPCCAALDAWLADRGPAPGPLFCRLDPGGSIPRRLRLSGEAIARIVAELGRAAGLKRRVRPHGLRHQAITRALEVSGGDLRQVQRYSRHARIETVVRYDDNRRDVGGALAARLAEEV